MSSNLHNVDQAVCFTVFTMCFCMLIRGLLYVRDKKKNKYYNLKSDAKSHQMQIIVCVVLIFIIKFQIDAGMSILFLRNYCSHVMILENIWFRI